MSARSYVDQKAQYGKETVAGSVVPADSLLNSASLTIGRETSTGSVRPSGRRFRTLTYLTKEHASGSIEGTPTYGVEMADLLELALGTPTAAADGERTARTYRLGGERATWTVEYGDATEADRAGSLFAQSLELAWGRNSGDASLKMDVLAGQLTGGHTLTAGATGPAPQPITAADITVYLANSRAGLDAAQPLDEALSVKVALGNLADPEWRLNRAHKSFATTVATAVDDAGTVELLVEATATGRQFIDLLRTSATRYLRVEAVSATGDSLVIDLAVQVDSESKGEQDAVYAATVNLIVTEDADGFSHEVVLTNGVPA